jgi:hypothetical protein
MVARGIVAAVRPAIDIVDSTWLGARPAAVAAAVADPANWRRWWPGLRLRLDELRGEKGVRWHVDAVAESGSCALSGSAEVWLQHVDGGVVAHFFLRLDPVPGAELTARLRDRLVLGYHACTKAAFWALGDQLDPGRLARHVSVSHPAAGSAP